MRNRDRARAELLSPAGLDELSRGRRVGADHEGVSRCASARAIKPGEIVLVSARRAAVGYAAVQLAKAMGAKVLAGIASGKVRSRGSGADAVID